MPDYPEGVLFVGSEGMLIADYGRFKLYPEDKFADVTRPRLPHGLPHAQEWITACKTGNPTGCHFDYAGPLTETMLLGTVAHRTGKKLEWDAENMTVTDCPEANQYIRREYPSQIADVDKGANWLVFLLPYVEQRQLYDQWDFRIPANQNPGRSQELSIYKCPSDPQSSGNFCSYAGGPWARGNYGMNVSPCWFGVGSGPGNSLGGVGGANEVVRLADITDGTSNTVAVDELRTGMNKHDLRGSWAMPGLSAGTAAMFNDASAPNSREPYSDDMENCAVSGMLGNAQNGMGCFDSTTTGQMTGRSMHPGGLQVTMTDGSARFVSNTIDFKRTLVGCGPPPRGTWQAIHTRGGGEVFGGF